MVSRITVVLFPGCDLGVQNQRINKLKALAETTGRQKEAKEAREAEIFQKAGQSACSTGQREEGRKEGAVQTLVRKGQHPAGPRYGGNLGQPGTFTCMRIALTVRRKRMRS